MKQNYQKCWYVLSKLIWYLWLLLFPIILFQFFLHLFLIISVRIFFILIFYFFLLLVFIGGKANLISPGTETHVPRTAVGEWRLLYKRCWASSRLLQHEQVRIVSKSLMKAAFLSSFWYFLINLLICLEWSVIIDCINPMILYE